jgi:hypothetical protein
MSSMEWNGFYSRQIKHVRMDVDHRRVPPPAEQRCPPPP